MAVNQTNATRMIACQLALAAILVCQGTLAASEVTAIGSPWPDRPAPQFEEKRLSEAPSSMPTPGTLLPPPPIPGADEDVQLGLSGPPIAVEPPRWFTLAKHPLEADWYAKFDYFTWQESDDSGNDVVNEHSTLYTLGYERSFKARRLRLELFTGTMHYGGPSWVKEQMDSTVRYLGGRAEFEILWDVCPQRWPEFDVFAGIGTRFWTRDVADGVIVNTTEIQDGFQETWVTLYPYVGMEKRWGHCCDEVFVSGRLGATTFTYDNSDYPSAAPLFPEPGLIGKVELGLRHENFFTSVVFEAMSWGKSDEVDGRVQRTSWMTTTGLRMGLVY